MSLPVPSQQHDAVVDAALAVMMRRGIGATTVQEVATEANISVGMFHYLVDSMDSLLAEAFGRVARADLDSTLEAMSGVERGEFTVDEPEGSAWRVLSILDGPILQFVAHENVISREDVDRWARRGVELELGLPSGALAP